MSRSTTSLLRSSAAVFGALVLVSSIQAQNPRKKIPVSEGQTGVHQMEILNGPSRTVRNFGLSLSPGEMSALKELERLENEAAYAQDLLTLKRQYVLSERLLEPYRRTVQLDLYGRATTLNTYDSAAATNFGYGNGFNGTGFIGGFNGAYGLGGVSTAYANSGTNLVVNRSLANGMGNEGVVKSAVVATIGQQATPTYAASVAHDYERAATLATASRKLQVGLRLPSLDTVRAQNKAVADVENTMSAPRAITLTLKGGEQVRGTRIREDKDWVTVELFGGGTSRVRQSEVIRIDMPSTGGIVPAAK